MAPLEFTSELSPTGLKNKFLSVMQSNSGRKGAGLPLLPIVPTGKRTREQASASHPMPVSVATEDPTLFEFNHFLKDSASRGRDDFSRLTLRRTDSTDTVRATVSRRTFTRTVARAHIEFPAAVSDTTRIADALFAFSPPLPYGPLPSTAQNTVAFPTKKPSHIDLSAKPTANQDEVGLTNVRPRRPLHRTRSSVNIFDNGDVCSMAMAKPVTRRSLDGFDLSETLFGDFPVPHIEKTDQDDGQGEPIDLDDEDTSPFTGDNAEGALVQGQLRDRYVVTIQPNKKDVTIWDASLGTAFLWIGSLKVVNTAVSSTNKLTCSVEPRVIKMVVRFSTHRLEDGETLTQEYPPNPEYAVQFKGRLLTRAATTNAFHTSDLSEICVEPHWRWLPSILHNNTPPDTPAHYLEFYVPVPLSLWDNSDHRCEYRRFRIDAELTFKLSEGRRQVARAKPVLVGVDRLFKVKHMDGSLPLAERPVNNSSKPPTLPPKPKRKFFL